MFNFTDTKLNVFSGFQGATSKTPITRINVFDLSPSFTYDKMHARDKVLGRVYGEVKNFAQQAIANFTHMSDIDADTKINARQRNFIDGKVNAKVYRQMGTYICEINVYVTKADEDYVPLWFIVFLKGDKLAVANMGRFNAIDDPSDSPFTVYDLLYPMVDDSDQVTITGGSGYHKETKEESLPWRIAQYKFKRVGRIAYVPFIVERGSDKGVQIRITNTFNVLLITKKRIYTRLTNYPRLIQYKVQGLDKLVYTYPLINAKRTDENNDSSTPIWEFGPSAMTTGGNTILGVENVNINTPETSHPDGESEILDYAPTYIQDEPRGSNVDTIDYTLISATCGNIEPDTWTLTAEAREAQTARENEFFGWTEEGIQAMQTDPTWASKNSPEYEIYFEQIVSDLGSNPQVIFDGLPPGPEKAYITAGREINGVFDPNSTFNYFVTLAGEVVWDPATFKFPIPRVRQIHGYDFLDYIHADSNIHSETKISNLKQDNNGFHWDYYHKETRDIKLPSAEPQEDTRTIRNNFYELSYEDHISTYGGNYGQYFYTWEWDASDIYFLTFPPNLHPGEKAYRQVDSDGNFQIVTEPTHEWRANRVAYYTQEYYEYYQDADVPAREWYAKNIPQPSDPTPQPPGAGMAHFSTAFPEYYAEIGAVICPSHITDVYVASYGYLTFLTDRMQAIKYKGQYFNWETRLEDTFEGVDITETYWYQYQMYQCGGCVAYDTIKEFAVLTKHVVYEKSGYIDTGDPSTWDKPVYTTETYPPKLFPWYWHTQWELFPDPPGTVYWGLYLPIYKDYSLVYQGIQSPQDYDGGGNLAAALNNCPGLEPLTPPQFEEVYIQKKYAKANLSYGEDPLDEVDLTWEFGTQYYANNNGFENVYPDLPLLPDTVDGWLHVSNGRYVLQGYRFKKAFNPTAGSELSQIYDNPNRRLFKNGETKDILPDLAAAIGCEPDDILGMLMDIPEQSVSNLIGVRPIVK